MWWGKGLLWSFVISILLHGVVILSGINSIIIPLAIQRQLEPDTVQIHLVTGVPDASLRKPTLLPPVIKAQDPLKLPQELKELPSVKMSLERKEARAKKLQEVAYQDSSIVRPVISYPELSPTNKGHHPSQEEWAGLRPETSITFAGKDRSSQLSKGIEEASIAPKYFNNRPPRYPRFARKQGYEGTVLLRVEVLPNGQPGKIVIAESSGYKILDKAAVKAVKGWVFIPARNKGRAIKSVVEIPIKFQLEPE